LYKKYWRNSHIESGEIYSILLRWRCF